MLDFETILELMKKYGYSSTSIHPYIYQNNDNIGICYTYIDEEYGMLERIKIFDNIEAFEQFLKEQSWLKSNGKNYNVRMILDNYESSMPKVLYLRNEKIMVEGEMDNIDNFDLRESQRKQMDEVSQILYEAGDLLLVYDEIKDRQLQYLKKIIALKNTLRGKYFDLQKEVDKYNKYKVERNLTLIPDVLDKGSINEVLEITIKDQYNKYIAQRPSLEEIKDFIKQVWDLNLGLELNTKYYEAQKEENDIRNEIKVVDRKLELMRDLNEDLRPIFGIDLVGRFKKINEVCRKESKYMSKNYVNERLELVNKKYSVFDKLNLNYASDYLREAIQNTNYDDLAIKYSTNESEEKINKAKLPLNDVVSDLTIQYRDKLNQEAQSILVLYNNKKFAKIFNTILEIDNFEEVPIKNIMKKLNSIKGISKLKTECYESVKKRIDDPVNENVKNSLFNEIDFTSFETYISSLIKKLVVLKNVNNKMVIKSDFNMYTLVNKVEDVQNRKYISLTKDLNTMLNDAKENKCMIGICLLKENLPVLYSPYYFDLGDMYSKGASPLMEIKEMVNFELLVEVADISVYKDDNKVEVARYYTEPKINENISYVDDIKLGYSTVFCKFSLANNLPATSEVTVEDTKPTSEVVAPVNSAPMVAFNPGENSNNTPSTNDAVKEENVVNENVNEEPIKNNETANGFVSFENISDKKEETSDSTKVEDKKEDNKKEDNTSTMVSPLSLSPTQTKDKVVEKNPFKEVSTDSKDNKEVTTKEEDNGIKKDTSAPVVKDDANKVVESTKDKIEQKVVPNQNVAKDSGATNKVVDNTIKKENSTPVTKGVVNKTVVPVKGSVTQKVVANQNVAKDGVVTNKVADSTIKKENTASVTKGVVNKVVVPTKGNVTQKIEPKQTVTKEGTPINKVVNSNVKKDNVTSQAPSKAQVINKVSTVQENKGFVTFSNTDSKTNENKNDEKQKIAVSDFKPINSTVNNNALQVIQKVTNVVKKEGPVSSNVTQQKVSTPIVNQQKVVTPNNVNNGVQNVNTNNVNKPSQGTESVKKNVVIKPVGSVGKPLNQPNNK